jgi:hypothetical protein
MTENGRQTTECVDLSSVVRPLSSDGAIAQLGERLLCKQEVVGSIPSGSTNLRGWGRFGWWTRLQAARVARRSLKTKAGCASSASSFVEKFGSARSRLHRRACALSDIVKRRSTQFRNQETGIRDQKKFWLPEICRLTPEVPFRDRETAIRDQELI